MILLHAWPGGLAIVVEAPARLAVAVFGPDGWRRGEPKAVFPDGPPPGTQSFSLDVPDWLTEQLAPLDLALGGVHTSFIRLDRVLSRLHAQAASGAVIVVGPRPAVIVLTDGRLHAVEPDVPPGAPAIPILAGAEGWVLVFAGPVSLPASVAKPAPVAEPMPVSVGSPPTDDRFVAASSVMRTVPDDIAAEIVAAAGAGALAVVSCLDGTRSVVEIAGHLGLSAEQVWTVVRLLIARKAAFRYVSRARPATGAKTPG